MQDIELSVVAITARDLRGNETPLSELVRHPVIEITTNLPLDPNAPPIFLFDGRSDSALLDDLTQPPLRLDSQARLLNTTITVTDELVRLTPVETLTADQHLSLVIAPWARGSGGERWADDGALIEDLRVTVASTAGATVVASWPANGASGVPVNLQYAAIGFDGDVVAIPQTVTLRALDQDDEIAATAGFVECVSVGLRAHACVRLSPARTLLPVTTYSLATDDQWIDGAGSTVDPWLATFVSSATVDVAPPTPIPVACALDETQLPGGCALVTDTEINLRVATDEAALITLTTPDLDPIAVAAFGGEGSVRLNDLKSDVNYALRLELTDAAGNRTSIENVITTLTLLPTISISEVNADPVGPEPQQEYVELFNAGRESIDLAGYSITDDPFDDGDVIGRSVMLHPGGRLLLVADDFDATSTRDIAPAPGSMLVRLGTSIANGGLSNSGEPLFLRDENGARLSATPSRPSAGAGVCLQRRDPRSRDGSPDAFVHDANHPCTPGL